MVHKIRWGFLLAFLASSMPGQDSATRMAFDVISVKPHDAKAGPGAEFGCSGGRFVAFRNALMSSVRYAYSATPYQVVGLPDWANGMSGVYDIEAKAGSATTESQCRLMVQALLADRFKMAVHHETRSLPVSALTVDKSGPKITRARDSDTDAGVFVNGVAAAGSQKGWTMTQLVQFLARFFPGRTVIDSTGLDGIYRFSLMFSVVGAPGERIDIGSEVSSAVRQLGLKIESRNDPVDVVVVDHIEKPDAN